MELTGLHHVTAVTANAKNNLNFYRNTLGLRLVKKTVNQDDVSAYHLFYGDETGSPGTEMTFFDWPRVGPNRRGTGSISTISLRTAGPESVQWWAERLSSLGIASTMLHVPGQRLALEFRDPEGQNLRIADGAGAQGDTPWPLSTVPAEHFLRGLDSVTLTVRRGAAMERVLVEQLGMQRSRTYENKGKSTTVYQMGSAGGPGSEIEVVEEPTLPFGQTGAGGVHHVAFRAPNPEEQLKWVHHLQSIGVATSGVIDRYYFRSLYFREPGGILFEIATDGPGFTTDESGDHLGESLALPPFLEPRRLEIEGGLVPLASV